MIRAGIIGCGDVARRAYIPGIQELSDRITVVATFDTIEDRADDLAAMFPGARGYVSMDEFLVHEGGMDLVFNLTPAPLHRQITERAMEAGYQVYTEKPIAATLDEAREMVALAERNGKALICAPATMVTARFRWMREYLASGEIGRPIAIKAQIGGMGPAAWVEYFGDPRVFYKQGVGPLVDTGVYMLHVMTGLLGPAKRIHAVGGITIPQREILVPRFDGEIVDVTTPDLYSINIDFGNATYGHLYSSFAIAQSKAPMFELFAEKGAISVSAAQWYDGNGASDVFVSGDPAGAWRTVAPEPLRTGGILESGILHAIGHIEDGEPLVLTAEHATHVLEIMNAALRSVETGESVEIASTFEATHAVAITGD
jgi:predicted dehydrogenase